MIAYLTGTLLGFTENSCLVLTSGGVGYEVFLSSAALMRLPAKGAEIAFWINTVVREDALDLYGFESFEEREIFQVLISISKLGPKKAQAILARFSPQELHMVVAQEDLVALTSVSGIGKKTGQQILIELKYKLESKGVPLASATTPKAQGVFQDALAGLSNLGYSEEEASGILRDVLEVQPDLDVAGALRESLKKIAAARA